ncbi:bifunctional folylpolyglutamate synthase/dihydrofolate synthase [Rossellomorea aquimaris]|uniref:bifunctional folylpolyglutamate synthase/dihydrofolate synthase n=1 Tax=Rossellomorea aquimaris TaxID=189382 RepID=UPI001CD4635F|nr:folylpolyglutamate synthase/dihydrofolate synthase family protein [Rossellomorea aquimaris]MCA1056330.1 bifunctional folylpolyglutamate synthase/dihydrofolate synthase [Rossellomorea aquimaris]
MNTYEEAVEWIHARLRLGIKPGLERMKHLLDALDNPQDKIKSVHIGGTNGKGSTVTFLRNILQEAGYTIGTFTSPYFERFNERISLNGHPIPDEELLSLVALIKPIAEGMKDSEWGEPSEFEVITAMSMMYFAEIKPDFVLYEVGLGGRLDSTNVITPLVSVITSIGMDHMQFLGDTIEEISYEKAGIIKQGVPVVSGATQREAKEVLMRTAAERGSKFYQAGRDFGAQRLMVLERGERFQFQSQTNEGTYEITMMGEHQVQNAALALKTVECLRDLNEISYTETHLQTGLKSAFWPGRMEMVNVNPTVILDGAHNPEGIRALVKSIHERFPTDKVTILFSALKDKELKNMISLLEEPASSIVFTTFSFPRAAGSDELLSLSNHPRKGEASDWKRYIEDKLDGMEENETLFITGSLYFLSEVKPYLVEKLENSRKNK